MTFRFVWSPWVLLLLLVVLGGVCAWNLLRARRDKDGTGAAWIRRLGIVAATLMIGATPAIASETEEVTSNIEVFMVVDRTGSMAAEDYDGTSPRLDGARADLVALTDAFAGARFSIIGWDSQATRQLPLTSDARAVVTWAETLRQEVSGYSAGSAIDRPLDALRTALEGAAERNPADIRLVFFLSDGENTDGDNSSVDASTDGYGELAQYIDGGAVLGYGTAEGGPMLSYDGRSDPGPEYIQDDSGADAISHIDEENLRALAAELGVEYVHRTTPDSLAFLAEGIDEELITQDGRSDVTVYRDIYWPFVWILVGLLAWEGFAQIRALREMGGIRARST